MRLYFPHPLKLFAVSCGYPLLEAHIFSQSAYYIPIFRIIADIRITACSLLFFQFVI